MTLIQGSVKNDDAKKGIYQVPRNIFIFLDPVFQKMVKRGLQRGIKQNNKKETVALGINLMR